MKHKILIVDDEERALLGLSGMLDSEYEIESATSGDAAIKKLVLPLPDLILLDINMPGISGLETCRLIKQDQKTGHIPIIIMTSLSEEDVLVAAFEAGADDFIEKPLRIKELTTRLKTRLKDAAKTTRFEVSVSDLRLNAETRSAFCNSQPLHLTSIEFQILYLLAQDASKVINRTQLIDTVWGEGKKFVSERTLDVHLSAIRKKLQPSKCKLLTVPSQGYTLRFQ